MAQEDYTVESLSSYLHLTPNVVTRMAERGKLPGRKVGGQWRFSVADIHHWFEERIGGSDAAELVAVEEVLEKTTNDTVVIGDLVRAVAVPLEARTRDSAITAMVDLAEGTGLLWDRQKMDQAVRAREGLHPTALDSGVALLHPRRPIAGILAEPFLALGRTWQGIPFGHGRGVLTDVFFLICSADDRWHLRVLARLSRLVGDCLFLRELRAADSAQRTLDVIREFEAKLE